MQGILNGRNAAMFVGVECRKRQWEIEFECLEADGPGKTHSVLVIGFYAILIVPNFYRFMNIVFFFLFNILISTFYFVTVFSSIVPKYSLEVKLPYNPVCPSVGWLNGRSVCHNLKFHFSSCSYRSTCFNGNLPNANKKIQALPILIVFLLS